MVDRLVNVKLDEQALLTRGRQLLEGLAVHGLGETVAGARAHNSGAGIRTMRRLVKPETRCKLQAIKSRGDLARHGIFSVTTAASSSEASGTEGDGLVAQVCSDGAASTAASIDTQVFTLAIARMRIAVLLAATTSTRMVMCLMAL